MGLLKSIIRKINSAARRKKLPQDEARTWMGFVNPGMLDPGNTLMIDHCVRNMPDGAIVEIGSFCGLSLNNIGFFARKYGRSNPVFSVDEWNFENTGDTSQTIPGTNISYGAYREHVVDTFDRNVRLFSSDRLPHHIQKSSDGFFESWSNGETLNDFFGREVTLGGPIAFAYIDGDHTYEQSRLDFLNADRHLVSGGFILFDDSGDWTDWGSHRTAREAASRPDYEVVMRNPNYLIRKR